MFFYSNKNFYLYDFLTKISVRSSLELPTLSSAYISISEKRMREDVTMSIPVFYSTQGFGGNLFRFTTIRRAAASFKTRKKDLYGAVSLVRRHNTYELLHSCLSILVPELMEAGFALNIGVNFTGTLSFGLSDIKPISMFYETEFQRLPYKFGASISFNLNNSLNNKTSKIFFSSFGHLIGKDSLDN